MVSEEHVDTFVAVHNAMLQVLRVSAQLRLPSLISSDLYEALAETNQNSFCSDGISALCRGVMRPWSLHVLISAG